MVVVELRALRPSDLGAIRRREVVEHAVQVHNHVLATSGPGGAAVWRAR